MRKVISALVVMIVLFSAVALFAGETQYIGAKKCSMCHKKNSATHLEAMAAHKHFNAFNTLKPADQAKPECVACHTTGFGKGGFEIKDAAFWANTTDKEVKRLTELKFVACEACHTDLVNVVNYKGHKNKKNQTYKPIVPTEESCKVCHNEKSPTFKPLNFTEEIKKLK